MQPVTASMSDGDINSILEKANSSISDVNAALTSIYQFLKGSHRFDERFLSTTFKHFASREFSESSRKMAENCSDELFMIAFESILRNESLSDRTLPVAFFSQLMFEPTSLFMKRKWVCQMALVCIRICQIDEIVFV